MPYAEIIFAFSADLHASTEPFVILTRSAFSQKLREYLQKMQFRYFSERFFKFVGLARNVTAVIHRS